MGTLLALALGLILMGLAGCAQVSGSGQTQPPTPGPTSAVTSSDATFADQFPDDILGRVWLVSDEVGQTFGRIGSSSVTTLAVGTHLLGVVGDYFVTGTSSADNTNTTINVVSDTSNRNVVPSFDVDGSIGAARTAGRYVFLTIKSSNPAEAATLAALSVPDGIVTTVISPQVTTGSIPPEGIDRTIIASPSGKTISSSVCDLSGCRETDIVDVSSLVTVHSFGSLVDGGYPTAMNDTEMVVRPAGDTLGVLSGVSVDTGKVLWAVSDSNEYHLSYFASTGDLIVGRSSAAPDEFDVVAIDPHTGAQTVLFSAKGTDRWALWPDLSAGDTAVIGPDGAFPPPDVRIEGGFTASSIDLSTRLLAMNSVHISFGR
jgi:hypothetical protein